MRASEHRGSRRWVAVAGSAAVALAVASRLWWMSMPRLDDRVGAHGFTPAETVQADVTTDAAETFALIDEHTAAIQLYQHLGQLWRSRIGPDDPRIAWNIAHEAWVRTLAGDRFTAEQLLGDMPDWLARALGEGHPYTRAVRLALANALDARGAAAEAATLRDQAGKATRHLLGDDMGDTSLEVSEPPGVIAHVAPNRPEQEGFRQGPAAGFFAQMTSSQRWLAGQNGWRLHLVARGPCRVALVVGTIPRLVRTAVSRAADGGSQVAVEGTTPPLTLHGSSNDKAVVLLAADGSGTIDARLGDQPSTSTHIDTSSALPIPPYALTFDEAPGGRGCAVVWLEIPFPSHAK